MDLMNRVYKPYLDKFVIVFIDDISIAQANKEYEEHLRLILGLLKNKEFVAADALSKNKRAKPPKVRALVMTINSNLPPQIYKAQVESLKIEKVKDGNLHGIGKELRLVLIELPALGARVSYHALET
ncbi:hypothetical protein Tco_0925316 [Tanacetum coccineum]|uniref:Reverse transcriptase domain-containing protein n=1 Tax=Tanacetum coccineum TaxID=301880 RepID=A0ABQ5D7V8_9ASTR